MAVYLYVLNTLADWEIAYITAELNSGRFMKKSVSKPAITTIGHSIEPIKSMGGFTITPDVRVEQVTFNQGDILILPGSDSWFDPSNDKIMELIPGLLENNVTVAAICGATLALAKHGILNTRNHTSNDKEYLKVTTPEYLGEALYVEQPVVIDSNLITATGLAPLEFSFAVLKKTNAFNTDTLDAWYQLNTTKDPKYFYDIINTLR